MGEVTMGRRRAAWLRVWVLATAIGAVLSAPAAARDGDLERRTQQTFGYYGAGADAVAMDAAGRAVVAGFQDAGRTALDNFLVARYLANGNLDGAFGGGGLFGGGRVVTDFGSNQGDTARDVAIDSAGRIIVAGGTSLSGAIARYLPNGKLDPAFGGDGLVTVNVPGFTHTRLTGVAVDASDNVVLSGDLSSPFHEHDPFLVARLAPNGSPDPGFGGDGFVTDEWNTAFFNRGQDVAIDPSGRIVIAGYSGGAGLARFNADGSLDPTFGGDGKVLTPNAPGFGSTVEAVRIAGGRIVIAGQVESSGRSDFVVARYLDNGSLDPSFNGNGLAKVDFDNLESEAQGLAVDSYGRTVVAGYAYSENLTGYRFAVARLRPNGAPDAAFGGDGTVLTGNWRLGAHWAHAYDVGLAGGVRPVVVGVVTYGPVDPVTSTTPSALAIARYRASPPSP